ncbi:Sphingomyelin phosphodiesterase [Entamoeba marina]
MSRTNYDHLFKILIIGESGVGKTAIMQRFCENTFEPVYISTVGVDFKPKVIKVGNKTVKMQLWDTAGQDRFRNITASYYRGTQGVLIVYDVTDRTSFDKVSSWFTEVRDRTENDPPVIILVGNKTDVDHSAVKQEAVEQLARQLGGVQCFTCSAKDGSGVDEVFNALTQSIISKVGNTEKKTDGGVIDIKDKKTTTSGGKEGGCC